MKLFSCRFPDSVLTYNAPFYRQRNRGPGRHKQHRPTSAKPQALTPEAELAPGQRAGPPGGLPCEGPFDANYKALCAPSNYACLRSWCACVGAREHYYLVPGSLPSPAPDPAGRRRGLSFSSGAVRALPWQRSSAGCRVWAPDGLAGARSLALPRGSHLPWQSCPLGPAYLKLCPRPATPMPGTDPTVPFSPVLPGPSHGDWLTADTRETLAE